MGQVLVLNASYEPLNITTWRRAMVMVLKGKAEGLEHDPSRMIRDDLLQPTVIRLRQFVRVPYRPLPLTRRNLFQRDGHRCQYCGTAREPCRSTMCCRAAAAVVTPGTTSRRLACPAMCARAVALPARRACPRREPHRPLSTLSFEATRQMRGGRNGEWAKYVIGLT